MCPHSNRTVACEASCPPSYRKEVTYEDFSNRVGSRARADHRPGRDTLHGNLFQANDTYQSVLSDIRVESRVPTASPPAMGPATGLETLRSGPARDTLHGNLFDSADTDRSVLSDIRSGGASPTAAQPGMGSGDGGPVRTGHRSPRGSNPDLDGSILYDVGVHI